jgi:hypothetical protein
LAFPNRIRSPRASSTAPRLFDIAAKFISLQEQSRHARRTAGNDQADDEEIAFNCSTITTGNRRRRHHMSPRCINPLTNTAKAIS